MHKKPHYSSRSKHLALATHTRRGKGNKPKAPDQAQDQIPAERRVAMSWAKRLKQIFNIDIETCRECCDAVKVIACIDEPVVINKFLAPE